MKKQSLGSLLFVLFTCACGAADALQRADGQPSTADGSTSTLTDDASLAAHAAGAMISESVDALADQTGSLSVSLLDDSAMMLLASNGDVSIDKNSEFSRLCKTEGNSAVVTITSHVNRTVERENKRIRIERTVTGSSNQTRTWSLTKSEAQAPVPCSSDRTFAKVDWKSKDLAGLKLDLTFERARSISGEVTDKKAGTTTAWSRSLGASGSRSIVWGEIDALSDGTRLFRNQTIVSQVKREITAKNKRGVDQDVELSVVTQEGDPLEVQIVRDATSGNLQQKTIKTGTLIATKTADGRIETTFENLLITYGSGSCALQSGVVVAKFFKEGASEPGRSLKLTITGGEETLVDLATGVEVSDFALDGCDPEDLAL